MEQIIHLGFVLIQVMFIVNCCYRVYNTQEMFVDSSYVYC